MNIGFLGTGAISGIYMKNAERLGYTVRAIADTNPDAAKKRANEFGVSDVCTPDALLAHDDVELIINLTPPALHHPLNIKILEAGKHAYAEKPLALTAAEALEQVALAKSNGLTLGCAPDTFLGAGIQSAVRTIDNGEIGAPTFAVGVMVGAGVENWHPNPGFYYEPGGGPLFDMGPYYITAMIAMLGPVRAVIASTSKARDARTATSGSHEGTTFPVTTPTHIAGNLEFASGVVGTLITSFDAFGGGGSNYPNISVFGDRRTLVVPDPNTFGGPLQYSDKGSWVDLPVEPAHTVENARGLGLRDQMLAVQEGRPLRASGELAAHVVEIMEGMLKSGESGQRIEIASCANTNRPEPWPDPLAPVGAGA